MLLYLWSVELYLDLCCCSFSACSVLLLVPYVHIARGKGGVVLYVYDVIERVGSHVCALVGRGQFSDLLLAIHDMVSEVR